jgi:carbonic anhydrase/acetyltransferase-like protein (isoleucine patch superfamily)
MRVKDIIHRNVIVEFSPEAVDPVIDSTAYVHPLAAVIGNSIIGKRVMVAPFASVRGDEGQPLYIGDDSMDSYSLKDLNSGVVHVNTNLAEGYKKARI